MHYYIHGRKKLVGMTEKFLPFDEAIASRAVIVIVSGLDGWAETLLEPVK